MMTFFIMSCEDKIEEEILNETIKPQLQVTLSQSDEDLSLAKIKIELSKYTGHTSSADYSSHIDSITIKYGTSPSNLTSTLTNGDNIYSSSYEEYECYFDENGTYYFKVVAFCHYSYYYREDTHFMSNFTLESEVKSITVANVPANEGAVDLGLSVKWAACNLGSTKPYEQGILSVWGNPSIYFNADFDGDTTIAIEDCGGVNPPLCISGTELDIATTQLGGDWRLPTKAEAQELLDSCEWIYTRHHGINGCIVIGPNGNSIFLPDVYYMTGCLTSNFNKFFYYGFTYHPPYDYLKTINRNNFFTIRPVKGELKKYSYKKVSSITSGKSYLMVADGNAAKMILFDNEYDYHGYSGLKPTEVTNKDGIITLMDLSCDFTFIEYSGVYKIRDTNNFYYNDGCNDSNSWGINDDATNYGNQWKIKLQNDGTMKVINTTTNNYIQYYDGSFRLSSDNQGILPTLYERID